MVQAIKYRAPERLQMNIICYISIGFLVEQNLSELHYKVGESARQLCCVERLFMHIEKSLIAEFLRTMTSGKHHDSPILINLCLAMTRNFEVIFGQTWVISYDSYDSRGTTYTWYMTEAVLPGLCQMANVPALNYSDHLFYCNTT